jgi:hypothetical protein
MKKKRKKEIRSGIILQGPTIGDYNEYFRLSNMVEVTKKKWVPYWLWKLVADAHFIDEEG